MGRLGGLTTGPVCAAGGVGRGEGPVVVGIIPGGRPGGRPGGTPGRPEPGPGGLSPGGSGDCWDVGSLLGEVRCGGAPGRLENMTGERCEGGTCAAGAGEGLAIEEVVVVDDEDVKDTPLGDTLLVEAGVGADVGTDDPVLLGRCEGDWGRWVDDRGWVG